MKIGGKLSPTKGLRMCAGEGGGEGGGEGLSGGNFPWGDGPAKGVGRLASATLAPPPALCAGAVSLGTSPGVGQTTASVGTGTPRQPVHAPGWFQKMFVSSHTLLYHVSLKTLAV